MIGNWLRRLRGGQPAQSEPAEPVEPAPLPEPGTQPVVAPEEPRESREPSADEPSQS